MSFSIGIDPGSQGAICLLDPSRKWILFQDTPNQKTSVLETYQFLLVWAPMADKIGIEQVRSLPNMTAKSNFSFGYNVAQIETMLEILDIKFEKVLPRIWQKGVGITYPKKTPPKERKILTAQHALELYPYAPLHGPRGGLLDGRADALMIAHHMQQ